MPFDPNVIHRAYAVLTVKQASEDADFVTIHGTATTPKTDRIGDIVEPLGADFKLPLALLAQHDHREPVGRVVRADVSEGGIDIEARIPKNTGLGYVEKLIKQLRADLLRGLSIGFKSRKAVPIKGDDFALRFMQWEWLELSIVAIPANAEATISSIKAFDRAALAASGYRALRGHTQKSGASAVSALSKDKAMNLSEKIQAKQSEVAALKAQLEKLSATIAEDEHEITTEEAAQIDELGVRIDKSTAELTAFTNAETRLAAAAKAVANASTQPGDSAVPGAPGYVRHPGTAGAKARPKDEIIVRAATCALLGYLGRKTIEEVAHERFASDRDLETYVKAAQNPALTTVPGWAQELVQTVVADFIDTLKPNSIYAELRPKGVPLSFGPGRAPIKVPGRAATPNLSGGFVGEAAPIRVGAAGLTSVTLSPHKMGVISHYSYEIAKYGTPQIEGIIRAGMRDDTATTIDLCLMDNVAASAVRPPGLQNGVAGTPSTGATIANILSDLRAAVTVLSNANSLRNPCWIINPQRVFGLANAQTAAGTFLWRDEVGSGNLAGFPMIVSNNCPPDVVMLIDAADFCSAGGDAPDFLVSETATLHEDTGQPFTSTGVTAATVLPITTGAAGSAVAATPVRSLFQTATIAIRMILEITWGMRRAGVIATITGVAW